RHAGLTPKLLDVGLVELAQLLLARIGRLRGVLDRERHLLGEATAHDRVVLVEPQLAGLAREQLFLQEILDQPAKLLGRWASVPLPRPGLGGPAHVACADADLALG